MNIEEYLNELHDQIRDKQAKRFVTEEIGNHIEEQAETYEHEGMSREDALAAAVRDMGDPVSVGADLDRIHRPHLEWRFLLYVLFISIMSIGVHFLINRGLNAYPDSRLHGVSRAHVMGIVGGLVAMFVVYRLDYTVLLGKSRWIGAGYLVLLPLLAVFFGHTVNGTGKWLSIGPFSLSLRTLYLLYLPLFAGILYEYRGRGTGAFAKTVLWMLAPAISIFLCGYPILPLMGFLVSAEMVLVVLAIQKGWYVIGRKSLITCVGVLTGIVLICSYTVLSGMQPYQKMRLQSWGARLGIGNYIPDENGADYIISRLDMVFAQSRWFGSSEDAMKIMSEIPGSRDDLVIATVSAYCGKMIVVGIILCLLILAVFVFRISLKQKNSLGNIVGCACGITIGLQCIGNLLITFGMLPMTGSTLPFISRGASAGIVDYILLGLILSIYRYKDIRKEQRILTPAFSKFE